MNCSSGQCSESDLEALRVALELAATDPDSVDWDIWYDVHPVSDNATTMGRRDQAETVDVTEIKHCASGECTKPELSDLKMRLQTAALGGPIWKLLNLWGKFKFLYGFKYHVHNGNETTAP